MKKILLGPLFFFFLNLVGSTQAQTTGPTLLATLDTVSITGTTRVLTLATAPGAEIPIRAMSPSKKTAVYYVPPSTQHEYDINSIRILVSKADNLSNTGRLLIDIVLPDSVTGAPSNRRLLPFPIAVTDREVRRAKAGVLSLDVRAYRITMPRNGLFVVAQGSPEPPYQYVGDTLLARGLGKARASVYVRLVNPASPKKIRIVNAMDFICVRDVRTPVAPQTWDYSFKKAIWTQRLASYPKCPSCVISNTGLELVVREL